MARGFEVSLDVQSGGVLGVRAGRAEAHLGVLLGVEEVLRAQVLVALSVAGVKAGRVEGQLHLPTPVRVDLEPAVEAPEVALDGAQAPEVRDAKLGAGG